MDTELISEDELDYRLHKCDPVNRAAVGSETFRAAVADMQRNIESSAQKEAPSKSAGRPVYRRRWVTLGATTAAVAVASLVGVETLTGNGAGAGLPLAVPPAAAAQLNEVARTAAAQPTPSAGQWEYLAVKNEVTATFSAGSARVAYTATQTQQSWTAPTRNDTYGPGRGRNTNDSFSFLTPQDRATYRAHKSAFDADGLGETMTPGVVQDQMSSGDGGQLPVWETSPTSDPQTLLTEIWHQYVSEASSGPGAITGNLAAQWSGALWKELNLLFLNSTSAQLRSTGYAALAYVPGVKVLGDQKDQLGRSGIALSYNEPGNTSIQTLIVSPSTGNALEEDLTFKSAHDGLPAGTVWQRLIFLQRAVVDSDTSLPGGGNEPFAAGSQTTTAPAPQTTTTASQG